MLVINSSNFFTMKKNALTFLFLFCIFFILAFILSKAVYEEEEDVIIQ